MLLQRFYQPTEGVVSLDGVDISRVDVRSLREQVSVVAQETLLITATIRENIALGDPETPLEKVMSAARQACAHDYIMSFPASATRRSSARWACACRAARSSGWRWRGRC